MRRESEIQRVRRERGLSSTELAHRLGLSQSSALRLEQSEIRGVITISSLRRVAESLGCNLQYEFVQKSKTKNKDRKYRGLRRMTRNKSVRVFSKIEENMLSDMRERSALLSPSERILQACSLSDLSSEIFRCSKLL